MIITTAYSLKDARKFKAHLSTANVEAYIYLCGNDIATADGTPVFANGGGLPVEGIGRVYLSVYADGDILNVSPGREFQINFEV